MKTEARKLLLDIIREPYAWPGGYEKLLLLNDGALLCSQCCRKEARRIMIDIRDEYDTGWLPIALTYEAVSPDCTTEGYGSQCGHCWKPVGELGC